MFQLSCLILYLKRNRNQRIDVAWALRPGSHWSSSSVVPTCPRRSLLHVEASLPLRFLDLVTRALWPYSATVFFSLIKGAGVFHAPPPPNAPLLPPSLSISLVFARSLLPLRSLPMIPSLSEHHPVVHDFSSPFSSCCSQNAKFISHLWVCLSHGFLFFITQ